LSDKEHTSLGVSGTSVSSIKAFSTLWSIVLGSWKVVASIQATHQYPSISTKGGWRRHTVKSTRNSFEDSLADVLRFEIDGDDLGTDGFGHSESGGDCVNGVYFGSSLEEGPLDGAELELGLVIYRSSEWKLTPIGPRLRCQYSPMLQKKDSPPDTDYVALLDTSVDHCVVGGGKDVR
jgi:hypothetical protein